MYNFEMANMLPGIEDVRESFESVITWGPFEYNKAFIRPCILSGAAVDSGNTPTTLLRAGLLLGQITASKKYVQWTPTATDGSQRIAGVLLWSQNTQLFGANKDRWFGYMLAGGLLKGAGILIPGQSSPGLSTQDLEYQVRYELGSRFLLDDAIGLMYGHDYNRIVNTTDDMTLTPADSGTIFTNLGDNAKTVFTLPAVNKSKGLRYKFLSCAATGLRVAGAAAGLIIAYNNATRDFVEFSTASEIIGGSVEIIGVDNAKWFAIPNTYDGQTLVFA